MPSHEIAGAHSLFSLELLFKNSQLAAPAVDVIALLICSAHSPRLTVGFLIYNFRLVKLYLLTVEIAVACRPFDECPDLALKSV